MGNETTGNMAEVFQASGGVSESFVGLDFSTPRCWWAMIAFASREQKAADWLREGRIRAYWPNYPASEGAGIQPNGRLFRRARLKALIPGFIFVAVKLGADLDPVDLVNNTPGLIGYMRDGTGKAATLTERDIQCIRAIEADENKPPPAKHVHNFRIGQKVRFKSAASWAGKIIEFCSDGRISVGVPMLGRVAPVKGLPHQIEAM